MRPETGFLGFCRIDVCLSIFYRTAMNKRTNFDDGYRGVVFVLWLMVTAMACVVVAQHWFYWAR